MVHGLPQCDHVESFYIRSELFAAQGLRRHGADYEKRTVDYFWEWSSAWLYFIKSETASIPQKLSGSVPGIPFPFGKETGGISV